MDRSRVYALGCTARAFSHTRCVSFIVAITGGFIPAGAQYGGGYGAGASIDCIPSIVVLPVEMLRLNVLCDHHQPLMTWATATERNNAHFIIERSADAHAWEEVGRIEGAGTSQSTIHYAWPDDHPLSANMAFYRLWQVDFDGQEEMLGVLALEGCGGPDDQLLIFPDPASDRIHFALPLNSTPYRISIMDVHGAEMLRVPDTRSASDMIEEINVTELIPGTYLVVLLDGSGSVLRTGRFMKM